MDGSNVLAPRISYLVINSQDSRDSMGDVWKYGPLVFFIISIFLIQSYTKQTLYIHWDPKIHLPKHWKVDASPRPHRREIPRPKKRTASSASCALLHLAPGCWDSAWRHHDEVPLFLGKSSWLLGKMVFFNLKIQFHQFLCWWNDLKLTWSVKTTRVIISTPQMYSFSMYSTPFCLSPPHSIPHKNHIVCILYHPWHPWHPWTPWRKIPRNGSNHHWRLSHPNIPGENAWFETKVEEDPPVALKDLRPRVSASPIYCMNPHRYSPWFAREPNPFRCLNPIGSQ